VTLDALKLAYFFSQSFHMIVWLFTLSVLNSGTIGQILKAASAFSINADIDIVMRFQPPSLYGFFHLPSLRQKAAA
jgi:hypothetical protein